jgi:hypothetical protein
VHLRVRRSTGLAHLVIRNSYRDELTLPALSSGMHRESNNAMLVAWSTESNFRSDALVKPAERNFLPNKYDFGESPNKRSPTFIVVGDLGRETSYADCAVLRTGGRQFFLLSVTPSDKAQHTEPACEQRKRSRDRRRAEI